MPNTGRPSRDCHTCRKRRVKCDLARPQCNRCVRRGQECPGYRDEVNVRFRVENISSFPYMMSRDNRRRRKPEDALSDPLPTERKTHEITPREEKKQTEQHQQQPYHHHHHNMSTTLSTISQDQTLSPASSRTISPLGQGYQLDSANTDFRHLIMARLTTTPSPNDHLNQLNEVFDSIQRTIRYADGESPVHQVCNAIGLAYLASKTRSINSTHNRVHWYRSALGAVNVGLQDPRRRSLDSTLVAVWMFNVYEYLCTAHLDLCPEKPSEIELWCRGISRLIRVRGPEQYTRQDGRNLIWSICYCIHFKCLVNGYEPPTEAPSWFLSIAKHSSKSDRLMCRIWTYVYHCTRLYSRIQGLLQTNDPDYLLSNSPSVLQDVDCIEDNAEPFTDPEIVNHDIPSPLASNPCLKPDTMSIQSIAVCSYLSNFRMHISSAALKFLQEASLAPRCTPQQQKLFIERQDQCMWEFWSLSDRVLGLLGDPKIMIDNAFTPNLGWIDAIMMYGAFKTIVTSQLSLSWQRKMAQKSLVSLGEHLGMVFSADDWSDGFSSATNSAMSASVAGADFQLHHA